MKWLISVVVFTAAAVGSVGSTCRVDSVDSSSVAQCYADSGGYDFSEAPDHATVKAICSSSACDRVFAEAAKLDLDACSEYFGIDMNEIVSMYKSACKSSSSSSSSSSSKSSNTGLIVGLVVAGIVVLLALIIGVFIWKRKRSMRQYSGDEELGRIGESTCKHENIDTSDQVYHQIATAPSYEASSTATTSKHSVTSSRRSTISLGSSNSTNLWDDPVIVTARIPFQAIQLLQCVSSGGYGEVHRAVYRDRPVAVKMLLPATRKDMSHIIAFLGEIKLAAGLDHPNIVQFVGVAWESLSNLYSVTEFVNGGDLRTLLDAYEYRTNVYPVGLGLSELRIAVQVADALTYLHSLQPMVLHRDLKSRNILLTTQLDAKLTDFGASKERLGRTLIAGVGTPLWMAPEVVLGEKYDEKADVYSFGVVLSELDTHELPYEKSRLRAGDTEPLPEPAVLQMVLMGRLRIEFSKALRPELRSLAERCVNLDPKQRPTAGQIANKLRTTIKSIG